VQLSKNRLIRCAKLSNHLRIGGIEEFL
jgi:hypothetical protein